MIATSTNMTAYSDTLTAGHLLRQALASHHHLPAG
jgi:hypothetical protein